MITTLNKIRSDVPCKEGWEKLLRHLGKTQADDEPLPLETVLDANGLDDALWCLRAVEGHDREIRLYAVWCARQVRHLMRDPRSVSALDVAERYARGQASAEDLEAARAMAAAASWEAEASWAAWAAAARAAAARAAAAVASREAAASWEAATAARAAAGSWEAAAAVTAARAASEAARAVQAREAQATEFRRMCREGYP